MASITNHKNLFSGEIRCCERLAEIGGEMFGIFRPYPRTVFVSGDIDSIRLPFQIVFV